MNNRQFTQSASCDAFGLLLKASLLMAVVVTLTASSGCRSGCQNCAAGGYNGVQGYNQGGYNPAIYNQGGSASRSNAAGAARFASNPATIAPPPTYSLNIPGGGANPYAQGTRVGQLPAGLINTGQAAPTPAGGTNGPANFNQQQGWRQINGGNLNTQSGAANPAATGQVAQSVPDPSGSSTRAPFSQPNPVNPVQQTAASNAPVNRPQFNNVATTLSTCLLYTSPSPRDKRQNRMPSSA